MDLEKATQLHSSHALNFSISHIEKELDDKNHVLGVFIDLSKAFDTIDHSKLLSKLHNYGIRGNALELIKVTYQIENNMLRY